MNNRRNYYRILHVQADAPLEIIKSSYRTLMLKLNRHPDRGGDHWNASVINEAYSVLSDPIKRARYDRAFRHMATGRTSCKDTAGRRPENKTRGASRAQGRADTASKGRCVFCMTSYPLASRNELLAECPVCRSPLYEARRLQNRESSKRGIARIKRHGNIFFYTGWPQKRACRGKMHDLSPQGLQFITKKALSENHIIKIDSDTLQATAKVACCIPQTDAAGRHYRIGAEFITLRFNHSRGTFVSEEV
jgi:curved DNA-binding protein CbpA